MLKVPVYLGIACIALLTKTCSINFGDRTALVKFAVVILSYMYLKNFYVYAPVLLV